MFIILHRLGPTTLFKTGGQGNNANYNTRSLQVCRKLQLFTLTYYKRFLSRF